MSHVTKWWTFTQDLQQACLAALLSLPTNAWHKDSRSYIGEGQNRQITFGLTRSKVSTALHPSTSTLKYPDPHDATTN